MTHEIIYNIRSTFLNGCHNSSPMVHPIFFQTLCNYKLLDITWLSVYSLIPKSRYSVKNSLLYISLDINGIKLFIKVTFKKDILLIFPPLYMKTRVNMFYLHRRLFKLNIFIYIPVINAHFLHKKRIFFHLCNFNTHVCISSTIPYIYRCSPLHWRFPSTCLI